MSLGCRWLLLLLPLATGCASARTVPPLPPYHPPMPPQGLVYAIDGAGGYQVRAAMTIDTIHAEKLPFEVRPWLWTKGRGRYIADQTDLPHAQRQARRLAAAVAAAHAAEPDRPISFIVHSAGSIVALEATKSLPPNTLHKIILMAPAVSAGYDLRPALACCRGGIEVFISDRDLRVLYWTTGILGTTDWRWTDASGLVGFRPGPVAPCDAPLFARLRHHPWTPDVAWTGNLGDHSDAYMPLFLKAYVLPLLAPKPAVGVE